MSEERKGSKGMDDQERYEVVCKPAIDGLKAEIKQGFSDLHKALFVGNGQPSIKEQLAQGKERMRVYDRVLFVVGCGVIIPIIKDVVKHILNG